MHSPHGREQKHSFTNYYALYTLHLESKPPFFSTFQYIIKLNIFLLYFVLLNFAFLEQCSHFMFKTIKRKACWVLFAQVRKRCHFKSWDSWKMNKLQSSRHLEIVGSCKCQDKIDNNQQLCPKAKSKNWWAWPQFSWGSILYFSHRKTVLPTITTCSLPSASHNH